MLKIDIRFKLNDLEFPFCANVERGKPFTFAVGEPMLADKLFWVLTGLDKLYTGTIEGEGLCFNASSWNNILALGDRTMFIRGSVRKNIYRAIRLRSKRADAKKRTEDVIKMYGLERLADFNVKLLDDDELLTVSLARAHFRRIGLVVTKKKINFDKFRDAYILVIS